jgi:hypothetical protein
MDLEQVRGEVIPPYASYAEYKKEFDREIRQEVEGYVRIGYLLKIARDTRILYDSGYANLYEFAENEYHIDKSRVSRYMAINDRFAEGGYSLELKKEYEGYGVAKLSMMLTLPDEINEELSPELTKSEIQAIRDEVAEEQKTTPIEHVMEGETETTEQGETLLEKVVLQMGESDPKLYCKIHAALKNGENIKPILAPSGEKIYSVRIRGIGRIMLVIRDDEEEITLVNERTGEKETETWFGLLDAWGKHMLYHMTEEQNWMATYAQPFPEEEKVAPVQPEKKVVKVNPEPAKPQKQQPEEELKQEKDENPVEQTIKDWEARMSEPAKPQETQAAEDLTEQSEEPTESMQQSEPKEQQSTEPEELEPAEQQLPGQMTVEDFPEYMPTPTISRAEFYRNKEKYRKKFTRMILDVEDGVNCREWERARVSLRNVLAIIDELEALCNMEVVDEEEQAVEG